MTITAKIIAHSIASNGQMIVTWELEYPRFIHGEFMTHRLFSRNAASSRAIPVATIIAQVRNAPAMPIHWGLNQSGMQAKEQLSNVAAAGAEYIWGHAANAACDYAEGLTKIGLHKQATNRILEPFQTMKTVMTATCMDNFFWLRNHEDAQPEIKELARLMWEALQASTPFELKPGEWHVPYVDTFRDVEGTLWYGTYLDATIKTFAPFEGGLEDALKVSSSCCAQVSYRKLDDTLEKAQFVYQRLVESEPVHASPFEHQATPMVDPDVAGIEPWQGLLQHKGVTHLDRNGYYWSGNFIGWVQHRQLIPNNVCNKYEVQE